MSRVNNKKTILLLLGFIALFCFGFSAKADGATYYSSGYLYSTNVLSGESVNNVDKFGYNCTIVANTTLKVQFSQDGTTWYSANHTVDVWSDLSTGDHLAVGDALALSGWSPEQNFYYRILFETTDTSSTPVLDEINIWYNTGSYATVTSDAATNVAGITATGNGTINTEGSSDVTVRGFQYGVSTTSYSEVSETGSYAPGAYSLSLTNLYANAVYYVRAFVTNTQGRAYGDWQTFTTGHYYYTTGTLYSTNLLSGESVNNVDKFGYNCTIVANTTLKVQFSQDGTTWYSANHTVDVWSDLSTGDYLAVGDSLALSGWSPEYNFYYRILFETTDTSSTPVLDEINIWYNTGSYATVTSQAATSVAGITATGNGTITSEGSSDVTVRGFQYGVSTTSYSEVSETGSYATGAYSLTLTNLYANAVYYVRAFVTNTQGRAYGDWQTFTTNRYYYTTAAALYSTNVLTGLTVATIDSIWTSVTIPAGTTLVMQLATDDTNWFSAAGVLDGTTAVPDGQATTSLSALGWSGANFYYKIQFTSDTTATPTLEEIRINYDMPAGDPASLQIKGGLKIKGELRIK